MKDYCYENQRNQFSPGKISLPNASAHGFVIGAPGPGKTFYKVVPAHTMSDAMEFSGEIIKEGRS